MYAVGDFVMKFNNGVCRIDDITTLNMSGVDKNKLYYVLTPVEGGKSTMYVSVDGADGNIRFAMTMDEAEKVIESVPDIEETWVESDKTRELKYKEAIKSGKPENLIGIIKTIYVRRKKREDQGKKNTAIDDRYFKAAENLLYAEIAFALGKDMNDVHEIMVRAFEK